jgi:hypothetical protein
MRRIISQFRKNLSVFFINHQKSGTITFHSGYFYQPMDLYQNVHILIARHFFLIVDVPTNACRTRASFNADCAIRSETGKCPRHYAFTESAKFVDGFLIGRPKRAPRALASETLTRCLLFADGFAFTVRRERQNSQCNADIEWFHQIFVLARVKQKHINHSDISSSPFLTCFIFPERIFRYLMDFQV